MQIPGKTILLISCAALLVIARSSLAQVHDHDHASHSTESTAPSGRVDLFNGKDLAGWAFCLRSNAEPSATWTVKDGVVHCTGQPYGYMRTTANYRDYKLTVEWRFVKTPPRADNTGVFIHLQQPDKVWPKCIECQGQSRHQGDLILMGGAGANGLDSAAGIKSVRSKEPANEKPVGEWNTYEIVAAGDTMKVFVNGKLMNEATGCNVTSGTIAIQSEGGEWEARKIFLEPVRVP
jgi:3-keto-disaccharide hydrolase